MSDEQRMISNKSSAFFHVRHKAKLSLNRLSLAYRVQYAVDINKDKFTATSISCMCSFVKEMRLDNFLYAYVYAAMQICVDIS